MVAFPFSAFVVVKTLCTDTAHTSVKHFLETPLLDSCEKEDVGLSDGVETSRAVFSDKTEEAWRQGEKAGGRSAGRGL